MKRVLSLIIAVLMITVGSIHMTAAAANASITYIFTGEHQLLKGYAEGKLSFSASASGEYRLCWGNVRGELGDYYPLWSGSLIKGDIQSLSVPERVAIPPEADRVVLIKDDHTAAEYILPQSKRLDEQPVYSYMALSDIHIDCQDGGQNPYYTYAASHFERALRRATEHGADFVLCAGDMVTNASGSTLEWLTYQKIIAESSYAAPIYEAIGNHEMRYAKYTDCDPVCGVEEFIANTGLDDTAATIKSGKPYYEITEPNTGDHYIFMALERGVAPNEVDNFSDEQMDWVEKLLKKYSGDGHRIILIQHSPIMGYGAGDDCADPAYGGAMQVGEDYLNNTRFLKLIETYRDVIWLSGHTHVAFADDVNYSNENGAACHMIHLPAVGGTSRLSYDDEGNRDLDRTFYEDSSEGYYAEAYADAMIFYAKNLYYDRTYPLATYIFGETAKADPADLTEPTEAAEATDPTKEIATAAPTQSEDARRLTGDVDGDNDISVLDATGIQRHLARLTELDSVSQRAGEVDGDGELSILDATTIQRYLAKIIRHFPADELVPVAAADDSAKAKKYLDAYYQYASYGEYQALKKAFFTKNLEDTRRAIADFQALLKRVRLETVYFSDADHMGNVRAYAWNASSGKAIEAWPGQKLTWIRKNSLGQDVYALTLDTAKFDRVVFNDSADVKTADIPLSGRSGTVYYPVSQSSPCAVSFGVMEKMYYADPDDTVTVYFTDTKDWGSVYLYAWNSAGNNGWPGVKMTYVRTSSTGKKIYKGTVPADASVIFSDGGDRQTADIPAVSDGFGYYPYSENSAGKWTVVEYLYGG